MAQRGGELGEALRFLSEELDRLLDDPAHWQRASYALDAIESGGSTSPAWCRRFVEDKHEDMHGFVAGWAMRYALQAAIAAGRRPELADPGFQSLVLHAALSAADAAHRAVVDRYGPLGKISGLHDLKVDQRMQAVVAAWHMASGDMQETARLAGVSPQAAYRFMRRYLGGSAKG